PQSRSFLKSRSVDPMLLRANAIFLSACLAAGFFAARDASATATFEALGSVEQVYVTGLAPGAAASLLSPDGTTLSTRSANSLGGLLFRNVPTGDGYVVEDSAGNRSAPLT